MTGPAAVGLHSTETVKGIIVRHPIAAYIVIAFGSAWSLTALLSISVLFGLLALFGPALGAIVVCWADGTTRELRSRVTDWRESPRSYLVAFGIPFAVTAVALLAYVLLGNAAPGLGSISAIEVVIFVLVVGEEIGWRGFLMPRLRARMSLPAAGLVTGVVWTVWHLPIYLQPGQGVVDFVVFAWWVVPFAVILGFVAERARYSVIVATVMHGAGNIAMPILLPGVDRTWTLMATGTIYMLIAVSLIATSLIASTRSRSAQPSAPPFDQKEVAA